MGSKLHGGQALNGKLEKQKKAKTKNP